MATELVDWMSEQNVLSDLERDYQLTRLLAVYRQVEELVEGPELGNFE